MKKFLGMLLLTICLPAYAFNLGFLQYSPAYYFTKNDWSIFEKATHTVLETGANDVKVQWKNPATGANGTITPTAAESVNGQTCRNLKIFNTARHVSGETDYLCCKIKGEWKVVS